ncbi:four helix bundle protein [bacterium]|nr:four helix bundle protein [bacterium]
MSNYKNLKVWQKGIDFVLEIYKITLKFPPEEKFGLISQMRRAAVSVASNIAEGSTSHSKNDFARFIGISKGSLAELETQLLISFKLGFITEDIYKEIINCSEEISRMLSGLKHSLIR